MLTQYFHNKLFSQKFGFKKNNVVILEKINYYDD